MTSEFPPNNPRAELEARLTAFILGELPAHDAATLRQMLDDDADLAALYERLSAAHKLIREAAASPAEPAKESAAPLRLSEARRQKLLAQFKTVAPKEFAPKKREINVWHSALRIAAVLAIVALLASLAVPNYQSARMTSQQSSVVNNLRQIDGAKQQWALENHKSPDDVPTASDLEPYMGRGGDRWPKPVEGETYHIGKLSEAPTAELGANGIFGKGKRKISIDDGEQIVTDTMKPAPVAAPPGSIGQVDVVSSEEARSIVRDLEKQAAKEEATAKPTPPVKTTIVLPPMDNSGNGEVALTWKTQDGSAQPQSAANSQGTSETKTFALKNADPKEVANLMSSLFPEDSTVTANESGGSMTITANREQMAQINSIVGSLDQDSRRKQQVHYYDLNSADAQDVQHVMQDLFPSGGSGGSQNAALTSRNTTFQSQQNSGTPNPSRTSGSPYGFFSRFRENKDTGMSITNHLYAGPESLGIAGDSGKPISGNNSYVQSGDPDWIGYLGKSEQRHSASNHFLSRGAFVALPQDSLDTNSIHHQFPRLATLQNDGSLDETFQPGQRSPVYIPTNQNSEFRFYLDLNGNGNFDTSGTIVSKSAEPALNVYNGVTTGLPYTPSQSASEPKLAIRTYQVDPEVMRRALESVNGASDAPKSVAAPPEGSGIRFVTSATNSLGASGEEIKKFYGAVGVDFKDQNGKGIAYNDRTGTLTVRGTAADLDTIESANENLKQAPPEINIKAKFAEITQPDNRALDNFNLGPNVVASGGTQPSLNKSDGFNANSAAVNPNGKFPGAQTVANATTTFDDATKYRQLTQIDNSAALKPADRSADFAQPNYVMTNGVVEDLTAPEVTTGSGRTAKLESSEIAKIVSPRAAESRGSSMRKDPSRMADNGENYAIRVVDGKLVPVPAPNNDLHFGTVPYVTGTYFGGINGQADSQYAYVPADKVPRVGVATEGGRVSKAESPRAAESSQYFSGIGAINNGVVGAHIPFTETTPSSSYAAVQDGVIVGQSFGTTSSPKGEFPGAAALDRAEQFAHLPQVPDSGVAAKEESERKLREQLLNMPTREVLIDSKLVEQKQLADATHRSELHSGHALVEVEKAWDVEQRNGTFEPQPIAKPAEASQEIAANSGNLGGSREPVPVRSLNTVGFSLGQPQPVARPTDGWTTKVHTNAGSIGVADGSVQQVTVSGVRSFANHMGDSATNANVLLFDGNEQPVAAIKQGYVYLGTTNMTVQAQQAAGSPPITATFQAPIFASTNSFSPIDQGAESPQGAAKIPPSSQRTSGWNSRLKSLGLKTDAAKAEESKRGASSSNPSSSIYPNSTEVGDVTVGSDPETKRAYFITDDETAASVSNILKNLDRKSSSPTTQSTPGVSTFTNGGKMNLAYAAQVATDEAVRREPDTVRLHMLNDEIKHQEDKVDGLRKDLSIVDTDPQSTQPGSSLGPANILHYNSLKIDAQTQYAKQAELLAKLKTLDKEELKQTIPTAAPDSILAQLEQDQAATESLLKKLKNDLGPNHPDVQRTEKLLAENNKQIDSRVKGIVEGMKVTAKSLKAQAENAEDKLNEARTNDINIAQETRPYYEARENLRRLVAARDQLAREVNPQSQVPAQYAKASDISDALKNLGENKENDGHSQAYREKKAELDRLKKFQEIMALRVAQESTDLKMPTTEMVETIEHADGKPSQNPGLGQRIGRMFTGKETQTARIKIERNVTDVPGVSGQPNLSGVYDPYFVQTEFEVIQSAKVLDQVIDQLKLDQAWAAQKGSTVPLTRSETRALLKKNLELASVKNTGLVDIKVKSDKPEEAAKIANSIAEAYNEYRKQLREDLIEGGMKAAKTELAEQQKKIAQVEDELDVLRKTEKVVDEDVPVVKHSTNAPVPQPDVSTAENAFSTFSLNISDVSLKLAAASLEKGQMPDVSSIRSEEFINAFDYRDPEPAPGAPLGFAWERAQYPFAHNRDLLRFAVKTAATGREPGRPLNIVLLLDKSGSMERADRVRIIHEALRVLATQLQPQDKISVVTFARVARLWVDGLSGSQAAEVADGLDQLTPEGGTNLEEAMRLAYETARRHYLANGINRVVLLTDGAANLGNVDPDALKVKAEEHRKEGIALDCFGVGWEGYNDDLLEVLSRNGGGRYGFINTPEEAATDFVGQLAGALNVAAYDVKVQVEFNPKRVTNWRQIGYAKHQLTKEQFRDNTVKAAQVGAAESGNGLYAIEVNPNGEGPVATVRVRYRVPGTEDYPEHEYQVPYTGGALPLEQSSPAMRLMGSASAFSEWLASSPFAEEVTTDKLLGLMSGVPETYGADERPKKLEWMIRQAKSLDGK